jgi:CRP/FNR family cyclic AMP-dependent transcriptional regulator
MTRPLPETGPFLGALNTQAREILDRVGRRKSVTGGEKILGLNDVNTSLYVIVDGKVEVRLGDKVALRSVGTLGPGASFGEMSLFEPGMTSAEVTAVDDTELLELPLESLDELENLSPTSAAWAYEALARETARRIREMDRELTDSLYWLLI